MPCTVLDDPTVIRDVKARSETLAVGVALSIRRRLQIEECLNEVVNNKAVVLDSLWNSGVWGRRMPLSVVHDAVGRLKGLEVHAVARDGEGLVEMVGP